MIAIIDIDQKEFRKIRYKARGLLKAGFGALNVQREDPSQIITTEDLATERRLLELTSYLASMIEK